MSARLSDPECRGRRRHEGRVATRRNEKAGSHWQNVGASLGRSDRTPVSKEVTRAGCDTDQREGRVPLAKRGRLVKGAVIGPRMPWPKTSRWTGCDTAEREAVIGPRMPWPKTSRGTGCDPEKAKASRPSGTRECQATESCHEVASQQVVEVGRLLSGANLSWVPKAWPDFVSRLCGRTAHRSAGRKS